LGISRGTRGDDLDLEQLTMTMQKHRKTLKEVKFQPPDWQGKRFQESQVQEQEQEKKRRLPEDRRGVVEKRERAARKWWLGKGQGQEHGHPGPFSIHRGCACPLCALATWMRTPPVNKHQPHVGWLARTKWKEKKRLNAGCCLWPRGKVLQSRPRHRIEGLEGHRRVARSGYRPAVAPRRHGVGQHGSNPTTPSWPWPAA
jgi:hypothetical protein